MWLFGLSWSTPSSCLGVSQLCPQFLSPSRHVAGSREQCIFIPLIVFPSATFKKSSVCRQELTDHTSTSLGKCVLRCRVGKQLGGHSRAAPALFHCCCPNPSPGQRSLCTFVLCQTILLSSPFSSHSLGDTHLCAH